MGNCIRKQFSTNWGGEDQGSIVSDDGGAAKKITGEVSSGGKTHKSASPPAPKLTGREVKIRITKKQLDEVLGKGLSVEQVLTQLMKLSDEIDHHSWRPRLQTIPEADFL